MVKRSKHLHAQCHRPQSHPMVGRQIAEPTGVKGSVANITDRQLFRHKDCLLLNVVRWRRLRRQLKALQAAHGIDGYKFDAGEPCFLPRRFATHASISSPSEYTRLYVQVTQRRGLQGLDL